MINIFYCNNVAHLLDRPKVVSAGTNQTGPFTCQLGHVCLEKENINEPQYDGSADFVTADGTHVHSSDGWLTYLKKYC